MLNGSHITDIKRERMTTFGRLCLDELLKPVFLLSNIATEITPQKRAKERRQSQIESRSLDRKRLRYWQDVIMIDSAIGDMYSVMWIGKRMYVVCSWFAA